MIYIDRKDFSKLKDGTLMRLKHDTGPSGFIVEKQGTRFIFYGESAMTVSEEHRFLGHNNKYYIMENDKELDKISTTLDLWRGYE